MMAGIEEDFAKRIIGLEPREIRGLATSKRGVLLHLGFKL